MADISKLKTSMEGIVLPDAAPKCKWSLDKKDASCPVPHTFNPPRKAVSHCSVLPSVLDAYGHTPLIQLNKIAKSEGIECELLAKCEFMNPGGSIKDRIAVRMIEEAERSGAIKPGDTLIEPTSGNTGIGLALVAAVKGYRLILVMLDKNSLEKDVVLKALGAEIIRVPAAPFGTSDHYISIAHRLQREIPNSFIFDQYKNPWNAIAHYDTTGEEILEQTGGNVDMVVIGAGTCGTLTGVARKIKERQPNCKIVAVDPYGSILASPPELNDGPIKSYLVEGIGKKFLPAGMDRTITDKWYKMHDKDGFLYARKLINDEGLLCGGSSGSALAGAIKAIKDFNFGKGQRCVVLLPDSIRNYMSRFVNDDWMIDKGFLEMPTKLTTQWWWNKPVSELEFSTPTSLKADISCSEAIKLFKDEGVDFIPVLGKFGDPVGVASVSDMTKKMSTAQVDGTDPVSKVMLKKFEMFEMTGTLGQVSRALNRDNYALVSKAPSASSSLKHSQVIGVITGTDFLNYISAPPSIPNGLHE